jgi:hypothetical protein
LLELPDAKESVAPQLGPEVTINHNSASPKKPKAKTNASH